MSRSLPIWLLLIIATSVLLPWTAVAQTSNATISGSVEDSSGAAIVGAAVTLTNIFSGTIAKFETTQRGAFQFANLDPVTYDLTVTAAGFGSFTQRGIVVHPDQSVRVPVAMQVGTRAESVEVSAEASPLNYETAEVKGTIRREELSTLPMMVSGGQRSAAAFAALLPGANLGGWTPDGMRSIRFNGGQQRSDEATLDGVSMVEGLLNKSGMISIQVDMPISPDAVGEMTVMTSNYDVAYGSPSAVTVATTKQGTNEYHGGAYHFLRNDALNANQWGAKSKPKDIENDFGAYLTAPLKIPTIFSSPTKKSYIFLNFEGYRDIGSTTKPVYTVPTAKMRVGDFSEWPYPIYDPATSRVVNGAIVRDQFMGCDGKSPNVICPTDPRLAASLAPGWLKLVPLPTRSGVSNNWESPVGLADAYASQTDQWDLRGDQYYKDKDHFVLTYHYRGTLPFTQHALPVPLDSSNTRIPNYSHVARFNEDHTFSPHLLNHFALGYLDLITQVYNSSDGGVNLVPQIPGVDHTHASQIAIAGYTSYGGNAGFWARRPSWIGNDMVTWIKGSHMIKFGFEYRNLQYPNRNWANSSGTFSFSTANTGILGTNSGNAYASFLLGYVGSSSAAFFTMPNQHPKQHVLGAFVGDQWKTSRKLTVNYGVRYDMYAPSFEGDNHQSFLDATGANPGAGGRPGRLAFSGSGYGPASFGARTPEQAHYFLEAIGPRLGLAYALDDKNVIRTGYGLFIMQPFLSGDSGAVAMDGFNATISFSSSDGGLTPAFMLQNGFPQNFQRPPVIDSSYLNGQNAPSYRNPDANRPGYTQQWNLTIEHQFSQNMYLGVNYIGNKGTRLPSNLFPLNALDPKYLSMGSALNSQFAAGQTTVSGVNIPYSNWQGQMKACPASVAQALAPFPQYCGVMASVDENVGNSTYHAVEAKLEKRLANGISLFASYTFSKNLDNTDNVHPGGVNGISPFQQHKLSKGLSTTDSPHVFSATLTYELPFGKGKQFLNNSGGILDEIVGGWQIAAIGRASSGMPIAFTSSTCNIPTLFAMACLPGVLSGQSPWAVDKGSWTPGQPLFNKSAFEAPSTFNYYPGAGSRITSIRGYGYRNLDASLLKNIRITERFRLQLRAEAFDALNIHAWARNPVTTDVASPSFGLWNGTASPPRNIQVGGKLTF